ncbi:hypothetical protein OF897_09945 [Chryseobacterium formosus]|uniref:MoxR-vWA-beta-propeller ternary system domain-containing protein n=1 Tax=Chryseobacterium formosus TaxID=1537363 RepID=A0ABT3XQ23_9FLAO|nr:hypothetical protein [Chryseobacterium formosus]MCX8524230.1 hypothetical protein [Chryseobacterium formosus]
MAEDSSERLKEFWAEIPRKDEYSLGSIRDWKNIQIAGDDETIWLKGFTAEQAVSSELKQIPNFILYELKNGLLFRRNALVPSKKVRTALLWNTIDKVLKLNFPPSNHNFFGIDEKIEVHLKKGENEFPVAALLCLIDDIKDKIAELPKFKLEKLDWMIVDDKALFLGTPLLSFQGKTFWMKDNHLLPSGFDFEFKNLSSLLQKKYNKDSDKWLLWNEDGSYLSINKDDFRKLSVSSFRLTQKAREWM